MDFNKYWSSWTCLQHIEPMLARHRIDSSKCIISVEICWLNMSRVSFMQKFFCSLFYGLLTLFILLSISCRDPQRAVDNLAGNSSEGQVEQQLKHVSETEVVESAKRYVRIFFQRHEQIGGTSSKEREETYFTNADFKPYAEFDKKLDRWAISFSNGIIGSSIVVEMNADATRGALISSWLVIPETPKNGATSPDEDRPRLVGLKEFSEAVDRLVLPRPSTE